MSSFIFDKMTTKDGLASQNVYHVFQDHRGFLWFATGNGLQRYDGYEFITLRHDRKDPHSLPNNSVDFICEDKNKNLWIATQGGLWQYNPVTKFSRRHILKDRNQLIISRISEVRCDRLNRLWLMTANGLVTYDIGSNRVILYDDDSLNTGGITSLHSSRYSFAEDENGMWIATTKGINYFNYNTNSFFNYRNNPSKLKIFNDHRTYCLAKDSIGNIWFLDNAQNSLCRYDPVRNELLEFDSIDGDPISYGAQVIYCDNANRIWVSTWTYKLFVIDAKSLASTRLYATAPNFLCSENIKGIFQDRSGIIWLATYNNVSKYHPLLHQYSYYTLPQQFTLKPTDRIDALYYTDHDEMLIGTSNNGLVVYDYRSQTFSQFLSPDRSLNKDGVDEANKVLVISRKSDAEYWIGTRTQVMIYDRVKQSYTPWKQLSALPEAMRSKYLTAILTDSYGMTWFGTWNSGLVRYDAKNDSFHVYRAIIASNANNILCIAEDSKRQIWVGKNSGAGFCLYRRESDDFEVFLNNPENENSLSYGVVNALLEDRNGLIWIGTHSGGIDVYNPITKKFVHYSQSDGLSDDFVFDIFEDRFGNIWVGSKEGISKFDFRTKRFERFETTTNSFSPVAISSGKDKLFFADKNTWIQIDVNNLEKNYSPPHTLITRISLFDRDTTFLHDDVRLPHNQNFISFEFAAVDFIRPDKNVFSYKLEGVDHDWVSSRERRFASYPNLLPGSYKFLVKAANIDGVWNNSPTTFAFKILPPWYQTWWFRGLLSIIGLVILWIGIYEYTQRKLRRQRVEFEKLKAIENERTRIAAEMHDDLGSGLTSIRLMSEVAKRKTAGAGSHEIEKISSSANDLVNKMSEIVWTMNAGNDSLENLIAYVRSYANNYLDDADINCQVSVPESIPDVGINGESRRNIFLVVKESLHNVVKHANADNVKINIDADDSLRIVIHDNGKGIDLSSQTVGSGLRNMQYRMKHINGSFAIENHNGTTVRVEFPFTMKQQ